MPWKNININRNSIKAETMKAVLISMPHSSDYDGYSFWHPSKLVRDGRNSGAVSIGYTDEFTFHLKKYGKGKWNSREVIDEQEIRAEEFEEAFGIIDGNIEPPSEVNCYETHRPEALEPVKKEAIEELKDD